MLGCIIFSMVGCMSPQQQTNLSIQQASQFCYSRGFNPGTDPFNRCVAGAQLQFAERISQQSAAQRQQIGRNMMRAGAIASGNYVYVDGGY